jgi:3-oxoacyl-[acyl-carrier protein] reductase
LAEAATSLAKNTSVRTVALSADRREPGAAQTVTAARLHFTKPMADIGIRDGVRVNAISPALVETERLGWAIERLRRAHRLSGEGAIGHRLAPHGTTRAGQLEEIGALTAFSASPKVDFVQGPVIGIDGGAARAL